MSTNFLFFDNLPMELQKIIILYAPIPPASLSLVSNFFNEWSIPLKYTVHYTRRTKKPCNNQNLFRVRNTLVFLSLNCDFNITDEGLGCIENLTSLDLRYNEKITNKGLNLLKKFNTLTELNLSNNRLITHEGVSGLTSLTQLDLSDNHLIGNKSIKCLTNLKMLDLIVNSKITNEGLSILNKLEELNLSMNSTITNEGLKDLTSLRWLNLKYNCVINEDYIQGLTNLTILGCNKSITTEILLSLPKLVFVDLGDNYKVNKSKLKNIQFQ